MGCAENAPKSARTTTSCLGTRDERGPLPTAVHRLIVTAMWTPVSAGTDSGLKDSRAWGLGRTDHIRPPAASSGRAESGALSAGPGRGGGGPSRDCPGAPGPGARWIQALAAVLMDIAPTRGGTSIPPPNPRNRANRHWRWRAYHTCRARSRVRLARVASIAGALSERDAGPPATRRSRLRSTLTKELAGAANNPATLSRFFFEDGKDSRKTPGELRNFEVKDGNNRRVAANGRRSPSRQRRDWSAVDLLDVLNTARSRDASVRRLAN
jgi:hypothetical protein